MTETIGFIGLGLMGWPMAKNLLQAGHSLVVHSRSPAPVEDVAAAGAEAVSNPREVAERCKLIITMVPDSPDVRLVLEGPNGVFEALQSGTIIIDMSTISPVAARELAAQSAERGAVMLDAPVSGGEIGAIDGALSIMVGGDGETLEKVRPLLEVMGNPERIVHVGESGAGQLCKVCNQLMIGSTLAALGEAIALARKAGVDFAKVREALLGGFAASTVLNIHGQRALDGNFVAGFRTNMYHKDMGIVLDTARAYDVPMPVTAVVQQMLNALVAAGRGMDDYSALVTVAMEMAGVPDDMNLERTESK